MAAFKEQLILAGDIGGTKTTLGLFTRGTRRPVLKVSETFESREFPNLETVVKRFLAVHPAPVAAACFGIAGPIINGVCRLPNLDWEISAGRLKRRFRWPRLHLINDLAATALAIPLLQKRELFTLHPGKPQKQGAIALLAPGTGLGQSFLVYHGGNYVPVPSEGGHVDFAPVTPAQIELWQYLHQTMCHVSIERVGSGPGLHNIYNYLKDTKKFEEAEWLNKCLRELDPVRIIAEAALLKKDPICETALDIFVSILGAVAGNMALTGFTTGGVFLGGGIPPKILPALKEGQFLTAYKEKGRFKKIVEKIPVQVILNDRAALLGAAHYAFLY